MTAGRSCSVSCPFRTSRRRGSGSSRRWSRPARASTRSSDCTPGPRRRPRSRATPGSRAAGAPGPRGLHRAAPWRPRRADAVRAGERPGRSQRGRRLRAVGRAPAERPHPVVSPAHLLAARRHGPPRADLARGPARRPRRGRGTGRRGRPALVELSGHGHADGPRRSDGDPQGRLSIGDRGRIGDVDAKRIRGQAARELLESGADPDDPDDLAGILGERWPVRLEGRQRAGQPSTLTISADD